MKRHIASSLVVTAAFLMASTIFAQQNLRINTDAAGKLQENPSIAADSSGTLIVTWSDARGSSPQIYMSRSTDGGATWSQEMRLTTTAARPTGGMEMGPALTATSSALVVDWADIRRTPAWSVVDICISRSTNGGATWVGDPRINNDSMKSQHQPSIAAGANGTVYAAWHGFPAANQPLATPLFVARSTDNGASFQPQRRADIYSASIPAETIGTCNCCRPWVFTSGEQNVFVAYRIDSANYRDVFLARSSDAGVTWQQAVRVSRGEWLLFACPSSGPVGAARNDTVVVAWMEIREDGGQRSVFVARSLDGGRTFDSETRLADNANFPSVTIDNAGRVFATWTGATAPASTFCAISTDGGRTFGPRMQVADGTPRKSNIGAQCVAAPNGSVYAVWTDTRRDDGDIMVANLTELVGSSSVQDRDAGASASHGLVVEVLPNPAAANATVNVRFSTRPGRAWIADALGRTVRDLDTQGLDARVTLEQTGVFFVVGESNGNRTVRPFVVVR